LYYCIVLYCIVLHCIIVLLETAKQGPSVWKRVT